MSIFSVIGSWFSSARRALWSLLKQVFSGAVEIMLAQVKDIAIEVVTELSVETLTDDEKRRQAFNRIKIMAKNKGIVVKDSVINLAIEIAVAYLKSKTEKK